MAEASKRKEGKPEIRFKGFDEEWYFCEFKQLVDRKSDISISSMVEPSVEYDDIVSGYGILNKDVRQKKIQKFGISFDVGDILYGKLRPYLKNWLLSNFSGVAVGDFWVLVPKNCENRCFYYFIQSDSFQKVSNQSTGTKMPRSDWALVSKATFALPLSCDEQKLIGEIFSNIDTLIINQQHKYDQLQNLKKAMLEKMFPREGADVPEIRFKGFEGAWNRELLNVYLTVSNEKNETETYTKEDVLSVSGEVGIVNQIKFQGRSFAGVSVSNYGVVHTGDIVYTKSPLSSNPFGIIKTNLGCTGIVSTLYAIYRPTEKVYPEFVQHYFEQNERLNNYLRPLVNKGAKNDMKVPNDRVLTGRVSFPGYAEQKRISEFFSSIDVLLNKSAIKIGKLQSFKSALLEKMFVSEAAA